MQPTADFYANAQTCIEQVIRSYRPTILEHHGKIDPSIKPDATPVTEFDTELEHLLREALIGFDSSIGFEGEELGKDGNENTFWLIDPIDGTESLIRGLPTVRNMVTLIHDGEPVFAFVYRPITDELFVASKGGGTYKNGRPVHVSVRPIERAWIELSSPLMTPEAIAVMQAVKPHINGFRKVGEFVHVAEGQMEGQLLYQWGGKAWDIAPRALLIQEAGGKVANLGTTTYDFRNNDALMASPAVFDTLMPIITEVLA